MKNILIIVLLGIFCLGIHSFSSDYQEKWVVPAEYSSKKNPTDASDSENKAIGKNLYSKHCKSCHGAEGYGDGPKADDLSGDLGDFSTAAFQAQTDGELFYKTTFGRDDMPEFTKKIPDDEDRWLIINHLRTLKE
ncbi:c-type cytochrome [Robiginitalea sp. IMCC44478]|uniref:c-type cytochrome n=1 Tax=Robiginitalea sp. IMCC44478 TaxID=3459122 RepID=UPI004041ED0E